MPTRLLGSRRFALADQHRFAALSGDFNPLHVDPIAARRTMFGEPVVHGMHAVAWVLERYLGQPRRRGAPPPSIASLAVTFSKPIFVDERVDAHLVEELGDRARVQLSARGTVLADVTLNRAATRLPRWPDRHGGAPSRVPVTRSLAELGGLSGTLELAYDGRALRRAFPVSCAAAGLGLVVPLLALSRLVGMECPGLNSLFSSFTLAFVADADQPVLSYSVDRVDPRVSAVRMSVRGAGVSGAINAFLRPPPVEQITIDAVARDASAGEFAGHNALVIGGSRGLGEVTAKIIAAGGGHPVITYVSGEAEAARLVAEIRRFGAACDMVRLDVASPRAPLRSLTKRGWVPTHLYYFATPKIFVPRHGLVDEVLFRRFADVYVKGFARTFEACAGVPRRPLRVFYPSTVAIDEPVRELTEYAAAKAAGETLCRNLERAAPESRFLVERLPRIDTDQTATLLKVPAANALEVLYGIARKLATL